MVPMRLCLPTLLAFLLLVPAFAGAAPLRLLDEGLVLAGVEAPRAAPADPVGKKKWSRAQFLGATAAAEVGVLAGAGMGFGVGWALRGHGAALAWGLGGLVAAVAAPALGALGSVLFADWAGTPSSYVPALFGGLLGTVVGVLTAPLTLGIGALVVPALACAVTTYLSIDPEATADPEPRAALQPGAPAAHRDRLVASSPLLLVRF